MLPLSAQYRKELLNKLAGSILGPFLTSLDSLALSAVDWSTGMLTLSSLNLNTNYINSLMPSETWKVKSATVGLLTVIVPFSTFISSSINPIDLRIENIVIVLESFLLDGTNTEDSDASNSESQTTNNMSNSFQFADNFITEIRESANDSIEKEDLNVGITDLANILNSIFGKATSSLTNLTITFLGLNGQSAVDIYLDRISIMNHIDVKVAAKIPLSLRDVDDQLLDHLSKYLHLQGLSVDVVGTDALYIGEGFARVMIANESANTGNTIAMKISFGDILGTISLEQLHTLRHITANSITYPCDSPSTNATKCYVEPSIHEELENITNQINSAAYNLNIHMAIAKFELLITRNLNLKACYRCDWDKLPPFTLKSTPHFALIMKNISLESKGIVKFSLQSMILLNYSEINDGKFHYHSLVSQTEEMCVSINSENQTINISIIDVTLRICDLEEIKYYIDLASSLGFFEPSSQTTEKTRATNFNVKRLSLSMDYQKLVPCDSMMFVVTDLNLFRTKLKHIETKVKSVLIGFLRGSATQPANFLDFYDLLISSSEIDTADLTASIISQRHKEYTESKGPAKDWTIIGGYQEPDFVTLSGAPSAIIETTSLVDLSYTIVVERIESRISINDFQDIGEVIRFISSFAAREPTLNTQSMSIHLEIRNCTFIFFLHSCYFV